MKTFLHDTTAFFTYVLVNACFLITISSLQGAIGIVNHVSEVFHPRFTQNMREQLKLKIPDYLHTDEYLCVISSSNLNDANLAFEGLIAKNKSTGVQFIHRIKGVYKMEHLLDQNSFSEFNIMELDTDSLDNESTVKLAESIAFRKKIKTPINTVYSDWFEKYRKAIRKPKEHKLEVILDKKDELKIRKDFDEFSKSGLDWESYIESVWGKDNLIIIGHTKDKESNSLFYLTLSSGFPILGEIVFPHSSEIPLPFLTNHNNSDGCKMLKLAAALIEVN